MANGGRTGKKTKAGTCPTQGAVQATKQAPVSHRLACSTRLRRSATHVSRIDARSVARGRAERHGVVSRLVVIWTVTVGARLALVVSSCGGSMAKPKAASGPLRVNMLSLSADTGYPGPASRSVTLWRGYKRFAPIARLVRLPLPSYVTRPKTGMTICVPVILTIRLSDRRDYVYRACQRPRSLRPVLGALCPLLAGPNFCRRYRRELAAGRRI